MMIVEALHRNHSLLKLSTGFATAAFIAWKLTVARAINIVNKVANRKTHQ
jgi:hypothetical protein